jgi:hypothetical protein
MAAPRDQDAASGTGVELSAQLPEPRLTLVYRLEGGLGEPLEIGDVSTGHRRIIHLDGGTVTGPEINGKLLTGVSADWQIVLPDGTALIDIRYALETDDGALLYVQSRGVRVGRGDDIVLRTSTHVETASRDLDWMNTSVFISVGGIRHGNVIWETYLVA